MKLKKLHIFFICYYAAAIIGNVLAAVLLRDRLNFSAWSAFPIAYILISIYLSWFYPSRFRIKIRQIKSIEMRVKYEKGNGIVVSPPPNEEDYWREDDKFASKIFLACIPPFFPFIFFLPFGAKILSGLFLLIPYAATTIYCIVFIKKQTEAHNAKLQQQRKDQQKQEELGKWK